MTTIIEFLTARYEEIEAIARAATAGPWSYDRNRMWLGGKDFETFDRSKGEEYVAYGESPLTGCVAATGPVDDPQSAADARHIALHDPEHVLADIASKRKILDECAYWYDKANQEATAHFPYPETGGSLQVAMPILLLLALPFADHPDYDATWRPR